MDSGVINNSEKQSSKKDECTLPDVSSVSLDSVSELSSSNLGNKVKVFLKIRPTDNDNDDCEIFTIINSTNLVTKIPPCDSSSRQSKHFNNQTKDSRKYKFTKILPIEISPSQLFNDTTRQTVMNFIQGQNSTVMNYGTSNSGKTHSFFGENNTLGLIPRSLKFLFSIIENTVSSNYKPFYGNVVKNFDEFERILDKQIKEKLFFTSRRKNSVQLDEFRNLDEFSLRENNEEAKDDGYFYSVWISFFEIYNEGIFDLLANEEGNKNHLKLTTDEKGNNYLKGIRKLYATSAEEAFQIMLAGKSQLRVGVTAMNSKSSRSHGIFSLTLLKYRENSSPEDVTMSTLTFCDLAGSGGLRMNQNRERVKESRSINASLLVLGRCLKTIQRNSILRDNTGPFRESNLTRYLQNALLGKENLIILVNLNKSPELYVETQNVLNFVSTLNKVKFEIPSEKKSLISRSSTWICSPKTPLKVIETPQEGENYEKLKQENGKLLQELETMRNGILNKEYEIRQELTEMYSGKLKELEKTWRIKTEKLDEEHDDLLNWSVKQVEDYYKQRINNMTRKRKRLNSHEGHGDSEESTVDSLELSKATAKIIALQEIIENLKKRNLDLSVQKSELTFELSTTRNELQDLKKRFQTEEPCENAFKKRRESFLFEFTEHWTRNNELQEELQEKLERIEQLKIELKQKDQELGEIRKALRDDEESSMNNSLKSDSRELSLSPMSLNKVSIIEEENSQSPTVSLRTLITVPILETLDDLSQENRLSFLDSSIEKSEKSLRTSDDDSGIRTSSVTTESCAKDHKAIQVDLDDIDQIRLKLEKLKIDYENLGNNYTIKSEKLDLLIPEMEKMKQTIFQLETTTVEDKKKLENSIPEMEKMKQLIFQLETTTVADRKKLEEYEIQLLRKEDYQAQLEEKIIKCTTEHVPKIKKLELELMEKNTIVQKLCEEMTDVRQDLKRIEKIDERMKFFEITLQKNEKEKQDLRKLLQEKISHQGELEKTLSCLSEKITRRDTELLILKENLNHTKTTNSINYKNTNELSNLVSGSLLKMSDIKTELLKSEESRNNMDRSWAQEYGFLRSQLSTFENQGNLLSQMYERNEEIILDVKKLKKCLQLKEREIDEMRKNRDETIERYDLLVDQLQMDVNVIKENKEYLALQESSKQLKKSISETFKFKKRKSKNRQMNTNDSKNWSTPTVSSSASLESIRKFARRTCQCPKNSNEASIY
ncbi:kinesin-like protein KIF20A [Leptopilina heterotoma]|uniref:kinesin-like protein KIF20A n=1 Tax=Leptopilina heterotoma TaxID=63436 RepID=UPI001CA8FFF5|nr:kinesin-like protein KIF20A [Leptopilina heterotoma]